MSWYYHDLELDRIIAITPRVASTSQRKIFDAQPARFIRLDEQEAAALYERGTPVLATIRSPLERTKSAYRRHKPGFLTVSFAHYVRDRFAWDSHVMPQTQVHSRHRIYPTEWQLFEDLISSLPVRENATPPDFREGNHILVTSEFAHWFEEVYQEDLELYNRLKALHD